MHILSERHFCTKNIVYYCFPRRQDQTKAVFLDSDCRQSCKVFAVLQSCYPPWRPMALCSIGHFHSELLNTCRVKWIRFHWKTYLGSWKCHRCVRHVFFSTVLLHRKITNTTEYAKSIHFRATFNISALSTPFFQLCISYSKRKPPRNTQYIDVHR